MTYYGHRFETPLGNMISAVDSFDNLVLLTFAEKTTQVIDHLAKELKSPDIVIEPRKNRHVEEQVGAYFRGEIQEFTLPLKPIGTEFQHKVWRELQYIPYGENTTYGEIAKTLGNPRASRAVGRANATNPIAIVIPCHRVVGSTGNLTGYAFGLGRKEHLLEHERKHGSQETSA